MQGPFIWFGLSRLGRSITKEIRTVSLATLRLRHEAERLVRRRLLSNGWLASRTMSVQPWPSAVHVSAAAS